MYVCIYIYIYILCASIINRGMGMNVTAQDPFSLDAALLHGVAAKQQTCLSYILLYCILPYYIIVYYTILYYIILYYIMLHYMLFHYMMLHVVFSVTLTDEIGTPDPG